MIEPDYKAAEFWFSVGQWIFNGFVAVYLWISRTQTVTIDKITDLDRRMDDAEKSIIKVCSDLDNLPGQQDFRDLRREITELTRELCEAQGKLIVIDRTFSLINEFLNNEGSKNG